MNILEEIIAHKHKEVAEKRAVMPAKVFTQFEYFNRKTVSLVKGLKEHKQTGIITEFKRQSPSKGIINASADVVQVASDYDLYGASAISILTDEKYFGGKVEDIIESREFVMCPILRKEFIVHEYQLLEAKAIGADVILLIAACLTPKEVRQLASFAKSLRLEVLLELHEEAELDHICPEVDLVGINNRNLKNFEVNLDHSIRLAEKIPAGKLKIAESGIDSVDSLLYLKKQGFDGFLMGEYFMKEPDPAIAFAQFVEKLPYVKA